MDYALLQQVMAYGSLTVVLLLVGFGTWVGVDSRNNHRNLAFSGIIITVALWLMSFAFWRLPTLAGQSVFWFRSLYFVGSLIPVFYYLFSLAYLLDRKLPRLVWPLALLPNLAIGWFAFFSDALVRQEGRSFWLQGPGLTLFALHFALFVIASLGIMIYSARIKKNADPKELLPVIAGAVFAFHAVFGVLFSSYMARDADYLLTVLALVGGVLVMVPFIIQRKLLVDLRLVGVELLIMIALFVFISDMVVSSETIFDFGFRLAILVMLLVYGAMTTRIFVHEIRQQRRNEVMQEQVIVMNRRLMEADRFKTKFVSLVAEQLHSPMTSLRSYAELALRDEFGKVPPRLREILQSNIETLDRITGMTKAFLDVGRIGSGEVGIFKSDTDLGALVARLVAEAEPLAEHKGLTLRTLVAPNLPPVSCDSGAIYHALMNLVDNAIKYTERGEVIVSVSVSDGQVDVRVTDTGIGMTDDELRSVLRTLERGMSAVKLESRGEGLGIFIAKQIVEAHGGRMVVESPGRDSGSTFGFSFPLGS
ncbi:MAG: ATP-binding protein [bacterium]